jgi:hypothetical protein
MSSKKRGGNAAMTMKGFTNHEARPPAIQAHVHLVRRCFVCLGSVARDEQLFTVIQPVTSTAGRLSFSKSPKRLQDGAPGREEALARLIPARELGRFA